MLVVRNKFVDIYFSKKILKCLNNFFYKTIYVGISKLYTQLRKVMYDIVISINKVQFIVNVNAKLIVLITLN